MNLDNTKRNIFRIYCIYANDTLGEMEGAALTLEVKAGPEMPFRAVFRAGPFRGPTFFWTFGPEVDKKGRSNRYYYG